MTDEKGPRHGARTHGYLRTASLTEALGLFLPRIGPLGAEEIPSEEALGRVTARPVFAKISAPHYHGAAMDGVAVLSSSTEAASESRPLRLKQGTDYEIVDTGDPLPARFDAVIMVEELHHPAPDEIEILKAASPRQHVRLVGEDVVKGELVFTRSHRLRAFDLAALIASGNDTVSVARRPVVGILATGDEVVEPGVTLTAGAIVDSNSRMLAGVVLEEGALPKRYPRCDDDEAALEAALSTMLAECDLALVIAGSSAGRGDFSARVMAKLGELLVHGVNVMPGKPCALGFASGKPIIGVPGYPVSAAVVADLFLRPALARLVGAAPPRRSQLQAKLMRKVASRLGQEELVRVTLGRVGAQLIAVPLARGAGAITSLTRAHGLLRIAERKEGLDAGSEVAIELLIPAAEVEETVLAVGSHDPALDLLADLLAASHPGARLASASVGSLGGLFAIAAGEAHLAGSHLLDPATGQYNLPDLERHIPDLPVAVITLAHRAQGLLVPAGNPRGLRDLDDLVRPDVRFVNRQRGSGTRVLLDHELRKRGLISSGIFGYGREEFTHAAVACAVASGAADTGLAVFAAANALDLDFIPVAEERYDLIIPLALLEDPRVQRVLALLKERSFRDALQALGGYDDRETGRRVR